MNKLAATKEERVSFWQGKRIIITGGTRGLGKELALQLVELGSIVTIVARTEQDLQTLQQRSDQLYTIQADISEKQDIHKISAQAVGMMEGIDILVNNASYLGNTPLKSFLDTQCEDLQQVLQTNLLGPFRLIKTVLSYMKFHHYGLIVNISSDAAINAYPTWGSYSISKAALDHMTAIWREELSDEPIDMVSVDPGDMHTDMHLEAIPDANTEKLYDPKHVASNLLEFILQSSLEKSRYMASQWREELI